MARRRAGTAQQCAPLLLRCLLSSFAQPRTCLRPEDGACTWAAMGPRDLPCGARLLRVCSPSAALTRCHLVQTEMDGLGSGGWKVQIQGVRRAGRSLRFCGAAIYSSPPATGVAAELALPRLTDATPAFPQAAFSLCLCISSSQDPSHIDLPPPA